MSQLFDLILKGGRVIDPARDATPLLDVAIANGRIAAVADNILASSARASIDCRGKLVLPGLIDTHAHVYQYVTGGFGLNADMCGVQSGVTTLVDQGGPSCMTLPGFRNYVAAPAASRALAFISAYLVGGLEGHFYPELYRPKCVDVKATVKAALENRDLVKGVKAHAELGGFARWGFEVIKQSVEISRETNLPLYIHFGQLWPMPEDGGMAVDPDSILPQVVELLKPGDILAHPFSRHPGRVRQHRRHGASAGQGGTGSRCEDRRRTWIALQLQGRAQGSGCRNHAGHVGRGHARLQHAGAGTGGNACQPSRRTAHVRRPDAFLSRVDDDLDAGARRTRSSRSCPW